MQNEQNPIQGSKVDISGRVVAKSNDIRKLIYRNKFCIAGRGDVFTINLQENGIKDDDLEVGIHRKNQQNWFPFNSVVEIANQLWKIKGIRSFAVYEVADIELLVEPYKQEEI